MIALVVIVVLIAILGFAVGAAALSARSANRRRAQLIPGMTTGVPDSWAGSHDPEPRLHRRIRDALAALRANPQLEYDGILIDARVRLESAAAEFDARLVALSQLPAASKTDLLADAESAVGQLESAVAGLAADPETAMPAIESAVGRLQQPPPQLES